MAKRGKLTEEERRARKRESSRRYYERNKEACLARNCDWQKKNPEKVDAYTKRWHKKNPEKRREYEQRKYRKFREWIEGIKAETGCSVCSENRVSCLDFHHKDSEAKQFCIGAAYGKRRKLVEKELEKCCVLCRNCHAVLHWEQERQNGVETIARGLTAAE